MNANISAVLLLLVSNSLLAQTDTQFPDRVDAMRGQCHVEINEEDVTHRCPTLFFRMLLHSKQRLSVFSATNKKDSVEKNLVIGFSGGFVFRTSTTSAIMEVDRLYLGKSDVDFEPAAGKCTITGNPFAKDHQYTCDVIGTRSMARVRLTFQVQTILR